MKFVNRKRERERERERERNSNHIHTCNNTFLCTFIKQYQVHHQEESQVPRYP